MLALMLLFAADPEPGPRIQARAAWPWPKYLIGESTESRVLRSPMDAVASSFRFLGFEGLGDPERDAVRELTEALKVKGIDWKKQMVVGILAGEYPAGTKLEITGVEREKDGLVVKWKMREPKAKGKGTVRPSECVLIPASPGKVRFDPPMVVR